MSDLLVAYDIPDDRRRTRVMKLLTRQGRRVQYSIFLLPNGAVEAVAAGVTPLILDRDDNVRIHPLCAACTAKARLLGVAALAGFDGPFRII